MRACSNDLFDICQGPIMQKLCHALVALALIGAADPGRAEVSEIKVAQQYAASFLPLMIMERDQLVEKNAKALGLPALRAFNSMA